jgi:FkbM family methyltransferase
VQALVDVVARLVPQRARQPLLRTRIGQALSRAVVDEEAYEPQLRQAIERLVQPGWSCADVGAHHGIVSRLLARLVGPNGRIVAFEAHPTNVEQLRRGVDAAGLGERVRVEHTAVTDGATPTVALHPGRSHASAEWNVVGVDVEGRPTSPELEVPATSLDAYFPAGERLDFVKIDVESAESLVLVGMRRLLREARPAIALEFHDDAGWKARRELLEAEYELYALDGRRLGPDAGREYHCLALPQDEVAVGRITLPKQQTS